MHAKFEMLIHIFFRVDFFQKIIKFLQRPEIFIGRKECKLHLARHWRLLNTFPANRKVFMLSQIDQSFKCAFLFGCVKY